MRFLDLPVFGTGSGGEQLAVRPKCRAFVMTQQRKILNFISIVRNSHSRMSCIFLYGSCMNFHLILKSVWQDSKAWSNEDHIITEIQGKFYDITGLVSSKGYSPLAKMYQKRRVSRAITQMLRAECTL